MDCKVMAACGPISSDNLGVTSMHDHLISGMLCYEFDADYTYNRKAALDKCIKEVNFAKEHGLNSMAEATVADLARDPELYKEVQEKTGVNIICSTGLYTQAMGNSAYWQILNGALGADEAVKRLVDSFMRDVTVGMDGTDIKCGLLKVATGNGAITPFEKVVITAVGKVQKESGLPIISHTKNGTMGLETVDILVGNGADINKIMIGHTTDTDDLDYVANIINKGAYVGLDRFGLDFIFPDEKKCYNLAKLIKMGYEDKIVIGHDYTVYSHGAPLMPQGVNLEDNNLHSIFTKFIAKFKELGITDQQINKLLVDNPRRLFEDA